MNEFSPKSLQKDFLILLKYFKIENSQIQFKFRSRFGGVLQTVQRAAEETKQESYQKCLLQQINSKFAL